MASTHHENRVKETSDVWLTPRWVIESLGKFDLDPCHNEQRPFDTATHFYSEAQDGLSQQWFGRVWLNPPFKKHTMNQWINKMANHGNGILLTAARTETKWFHTIWQHSSGILFLSRRIHFCLPDGNKPPKSAPGFPVALAAFGEDNKEQLRESGLEGAWVERVDWITKDKL